MDATHCYPSHFLDQYMIFASDNTVLTTIVVSVTKMIDRATSTEFDETGHVYRVVNGRAYDFKDNQLIYGWDTKKELFDANVMKTRMLEHLSLYFESLEAMHIWANRICESSTKHVGILSGSASLIATAPIAIEQKHCMHDQVVAAIK